MGDQIDELLSDLAYDGAEFIQWKHLTKTNIIKVQHDIAVREYNAPKIYEIDFGTKQRVADECGVQFLVDGLKGRDKFKTLTRQSVRADFGEVIRISDIVAWCKQRSVGLTLVDNFMSQYHYHARGDAHGASHLYGRINNDHYSY